MSKDKKYTYEFVERDETNPLNDKIVKKGVEIEFSMFELDRYTEAALKQLDEYRGKLNIESAKMSNVEDNHDDAIALVRDLDPVKQEAIKIWLNSKGVVDALAPRRDELEESLAEHQAEIEEIKKQTGWAAPVNEPENGDDQEEPASGEGKEGDEG